MHGVRIQHIYTYYNFKYGLKQFLKQIKSKLQLSFVPSVLIEHVNVRTASYSLAHKQLPQPVKTFVISRMIAMDYYIYFADKYLVVHAVTMDMTLQSQITIFDSSAPCTIARTAHTVLHQGLLDDFYTYI